VHPVATNYNISLPEATVVVTITNAGPFPAAVNFIPPITGKTLVSDLRPISRDLPVAPAMGIRTDWPSIEEARRKYDAAVLRHASLTPFLSADDQGGPRSAKNPQKGVAFGRRVPENARQ
jgi:hypothetical protein